MAVECACIYEIQPCQHDGMIFPLNVPNNLMRDTLLTPLFWLLF